MKLLIVALIRNEAADLSFLGVSPASEGPNIHTEKHTTNMSFQYVC